ncbi:MAG: 2-oxo acid dehydrogenase subunit E2 [Oscillospiraceae bacterium]|nr:2-oxo acid dehydrogenase subunit E2 [Oscillospiraceae bacterium]
MATIIIMPRQGQSVESCVITAWNKKVGDEVSVGDVLFSYETDKSSFEEKSTVDGVLLEIMAEEGEDVPCLDPVCSIGNVGEKVDVAVETKTDDNLKIKISPRAKNLAEKTDADITKAIPTGPNGRIVERDINTLLDKVPAAPEATIEKPIAPVVEKVIEVKETKTIKENYTDVKLPNIRKVIAKAMHASLSTMAQLTLNSSFDAEQINKYRALVKANAEKFALENITLNDIVIYAVAKTLKNHKDLNAHYLYEEETMRYFDDVHMGVAVDTDRGLIVPTLFNADKMSLNEIAKATKAIIKEAQAGSISPDKLVGATFTVTNLGSLGVESFTPVINPPQTGILGVDTLMRRVKEVDGKDVFYTAMGLSLTFDHRALDGAPAAKFLKDLCFNLENFNLLLAK